MKKKFNVYQILPKSLIVEGTYDSDYKPFAETTTVLEFQDSFDTKQLAENYIHLTMINNDWARKLHYTVLTVYEYHK